MSRRYVRDSRGRFATTGSSGSDKPAVRAAKGGKKADDDELVTLYHRTSRRNADSIVNSQDFIPNAERDSRIYFSNEHSGAGRDYGPAVVSVEVPRSQLKVDNFSGWGGPGSRHPNEKFYSVDPSALKGRKLWRGTGAPEPRSPFSAKGGW